MTQSPWNCRHPDTVAPWTPGTLGTPQETSTPEPTPTETVTPTPTPTTYITLDQNFPERMHINQTAIAVLQVSCHESITIEAKIEQIGGSNGNAIFSNGSSVYEFDVTSGSYSLEVTATQNSNAFGNLELSVRKKGERQESDSLSFYVLTLPENFRYQLLYSSPCLGWCDSSDYKYARRTANVYDSESGYYQDLTDIVIYEMVLINHRDPVFCDNGSINQWDIAVVFPAIGAPVYGKPEQTFHTDNIGYPQHLINLPQISEGIRTSSVALYSCPAWAQSSSNVILLEGPYIHTQEVSDVGNSYKLSILTTNLSIPCNWTLPQTYSTCDKLNSISIPKPTPIKQK